jgi:hypothetical protein
MVDDPALLGALAGDPILRRPPLLMLLNVTANDCDCVCVCIGRRRAWLRQAAEQKE